MAPIRHFAVLNRLVKRNFIQSFPFNSLNSVEMRFETKIAHAKLQSTFEPERSESTEIKQQQETNQTKRKSEFVLNARAHT